MNMWGSEKFLVLGLEELVGPGHAYGSVLESVVSNFKLSCKTTYIHQYLSYKKISEQSLEWFVRNSLDKICTVLGKPAGQP